MVMLSLQGTMSNSLLGYMGVQGHDSLLNASEIL